MQTMNQCLATLYLSGQITLETAMAASALKDELDRHGPARHGRRGRGGPRPARGAAPPVRQEEGQHDGDICIFGTHARGPDGQRRATGRVGRRRDGAVAARADPRHEDRADQDARGGRARQAGGGARARHPHQEPRDLHAAVLGDDRRRPAARAVPRHPRQAGGAQVLLAGHPQDARRRRGRRVAGRRHEAAPARLRQPVHEHGGGRRGRRHPRHDPQAPGDLHREERQAQGAGEVGDDLPGRGHLDRRPRRHRHPVEGHPDLRAVVRRPRRRAAAAHPHRHLAEQQPRHLHAGDRRRPHRDRVHGAPVLQHRARPARHRRRPAEDAHPRHHPAQGRRRPLLPHAVDADELGRADPRRPR